MALYSFRCRKGHETARWFEMAVAPKCGSKTRCDECGRKAVRVLTATPMLGGMNYKAFERQSVALLHPDDIRAGKGFKSVAEIDAHCKAHGLEHTGGTMPSKFKEMRKKRERGEVD